MRLASILCLTFCMVGASLAENSVTRLNLNNGKLTVSQSYCRICADTARTCRLKCNGSGACIQACDDAFQDCVEQNCGRRY